MIILRRKCGKARCSNIHAILAATRIRLLVSRPALVGVCSEGDVGEVLEPEAVGDAEDGEGGGDDHEVLVVPALAGGWQYLVLGTA